MEVFQQVDKDNSGEINVQELSEMLLLDELSEALGERTPNNKKEALALATMIMGRFAHESMFGFGFGEWNDFLACLKSIVSGEDGSEERVLENGEEEDATTALRRPSIIIASSLSQRSPTSPAHARRSSTSPAYHSSPAAAPPTAASDLVLRYQFEALQAGQEAIDERKINAALQQQILELIQHNRKTEERRIQLTNENKHLKQSVREQAYEADDEIQRLKMQKLQAGGQIECLNNELQELKKKSQHELLNSSILEYSHQLENSTQLELVQKAYEKSLQELEELKKRNSSRRRKGVDEGTHPPRNSGRKRQLSLLLLSSSEQSQVIEVLNDIIEQTEISSTAEYAVWEKENKESVLKESNNHRDEDCCILS